MREAPPPELASQLQRLGLATARDLAWASGRVRRLARDLPRFESVWIDALQQTGVLTPYQASELHAGRGALLRCGPGLLRRRIAAHGYAHTFEARANEPRRLLRMTLAPAGDCTGAAPVAAREAALSELVRRLQSREIPGVLAIERAGFDPEQNRLWTASPAVRGTLLHDRLLRHGRFPPEIVLEIARQMAASLAALAEIGVVHADPSATRVLITPAGEVVLTEPGLRAIVRPEEGYAHAGVAAEACDYLAPEQIADGAPPSVATDLFACGLLWRRLLTGRAPLGGGNSLCRMRTAHQARFPDLARLTIDVPPALTTAVQACLAAAPGDRPASFAALAAQLGPSTPESRRELARFAVDRRVRPLARPVAAPTSEAPAFTPRQLAFSAAAVLALAAATRPWWPAFTDGLTSATAAAHARVDPPRAPFPAVTAQQSKGSETLPALGGLLQRRTAVAAPTLPAAPAVPTVTQPKLPDAVPAEPSPAPQPYTLASNGDVVLPADRPLALEHLKLTPGQVVRGPGGSARPTILTPQSGLWVEAERVTFVGINFVWNGAAERQLARVRPSAIVRLGVEKCTFQDCAFVGELPDAGLSDETLPAAIRWPGPDRDAKVAALPTGQLRVERCVLRRVQAGVRSEFPGAVVLDLSGSLVLGPGPAVQLQRWPQVDEPVALALTNTTLRGMRAVLESGAGAENTSPGSVSIQAQNVALAPAATGALFLFTGPTNPARSLAACEWSGEDSLVIPGVPLAAWRDPAGELRPAREDQVSASGLVRGQIGFAGEADAGAAASRILRWTGPRRSPEPPGAGDGALPWP